MRKFSTEIFELHQLGELFSRLKPLKKKGIAEEIREIYEAHVREMKKREKAK